MDRCDECGFEYDLDLAGGAAALVREGAADVASMLRYGAQAAIGARTRDGTWSPLEYGCHLRDVLIVQRERVLQVRRVDQPSSTPMGRDERAEHDGYLFQDHLDVARQLADAAQLFANVLDRLNDDDWHRTIVYHYPTPTTRTLTWLAMHTAHEIRHHQFDIHRALR